MYVIASLSLLDRHQQNTEAMLPMFIRKAESVIELRFVALGPALIASQAVQYCLRLRRRSRTA
jgi:hypothetical protein